MMIILTAFLLFGAVFCDDELGVTDWPDYHHSTGKRISSGAARQMYGSGQLRSAGAMKMAATTQPTRPRSQRPYNSDSDYDDGQGSHYGSGGYHEHEDLDDVLYHPDEHGNPPPIMPVQAYDPSSVRTFGKTRISGGISVPSIGVGRGPDIYGSRQLGVRHGDAVNWREWDRVSGGNHGHRTPEGFVPEHEIVPEEEGLIGDDHHDPGHCTITCETWEFLCPVSCACIHKDNRCDGILDCEQQEDEQECKEINEALVKETRTACESTGVHIMCPATLKCINKEWLCDGDDDCGDYSDETHCGARHNCSEDQFECGNGLCIQKSWLCDGDNDCKDFSDELNCTKLACTPQEYQCVDGSCVSLPFRCDGEHDCDDGSDEASCETPMPLCAEGEFKCKSGSTSTGGGSGFGVGSNTEGRCILNRFRCDGDNDCGDWSDEESCPRKLSSCTTNEFKCDDGTCIPFRWHCDREQDCDGGEDEKKCTDSEKEKSKTCAPDEYTCKDGRCILKTWVCDGIADCKRSEDELDCEVHCEIGQFSCPPHRNSSNVKICVNQKHICDGHNDCPGAEDEQNCPKPRQCGPNSKCEQLCIVTSKGRDECACRLGYTLHPNGYNCTDIDECQFLSDPVCSQNCINTMGSFTCSCAMGYILRPDLRTCKALGGAVKLIMANRADLRQVALSSNKYTSILKGLHNAIALDYHYAAQLIFWSDVSTDTIKRAFINGTGVKDVVKWGLESPGGVAVDWIHNLVFWTDSGTRRVEVGTFDGELRAVVAANDLDKPRAIVVHPGEALVFWTDWGPNPKIERAYMDGSERKTVTKDGVFWPNGLTVDYPAKKIYWADAKHHVIESSNFDGGDRKKVLSNHLPHPFALTIFEDSLYWTDWHTKSISTANKVTGKGFRNIHENLHFPMDIHSYHPARQPIYNNHCKLDSQYKPGGCSHLCLPNKNYRRCECPIGLTLKADQKTCTSVPDKLLLVARKKDIRIRQLEPLTKSVQIDMVIPLDGLKAAVALDWCSKNDYIYWTDVGRGVISRAHLNGSSQETIINANLLSPAGLALDWVTDKIYWTDPGTNRIEVATTDGKQRALLIWQKLEKPRDIVVNPVDSLMFWSDWGDKPKIERAGMDGSDRKTIASSALLWPNGLAIDQSSNRLYFVDGGTKTLEIMNFDGSGRSKLIYAGLQHPFGMDIFDNKIYWTDWETFSVEQADRRTGQDRKALISNTTDLMDIRVFHRERRYVNNPCQINNGGCSHICLLNPTGFTCACPIGVKLTEDNRTCKNGPSNYVIFAHRIDIRQMSLDIDYQIDVVLPIPPISNAVAVDVDLTTGDVYWSDTVEDVIMRSSTDGFSNEQILSESLDSVDGMVIDSIGRKLYWSDAGRHTIEVSELNGNNRKVLIYQDLESPRGIAIDYESGYLFWSDWGSYPKIERSFMDGEQRTKIVTSNLGWPNSLTVDSKSQKLYWTDAQAKTIEYCDFDGNSRKKFLSDLQHPYGVAVSSSRIYWTDWKTKSLNEADLNTKIQKRLMDDLEGLMDVKVIEEKKKITDNACGYDNGGCSHLCLRKPNGFSCKCPTGIQMKTDSQKDCEILPKNYLLIALRSGIGRIALDSTDFFDVVLPIEGVHGAVVLDYHYNKSLIFYGDVNVDAIKTVNIEDPLESKTIISTGLHTPNGIAIDWMANNIFWTDTGLKVMEVARLDGSSRKVILKTDLSDPRAMILHPKKGLIFWADWAHSPKIERCYMDGSGRKAVVDSKLGYPNGLAIDFESNKLFWVDALEDRIEACDFEGGNRNQIVAHAPHPFGVTVFQSFVYWTDWYNKSVFRAPISPNSDNKNVQEVRRGLRSALEIRSVSALRQPYLYNPCKHENGGCTHLCLFREKSYVCACPDKPDGRECKLEPSTIVPVHDKDEIGVTEVPGGGQSAQGTAGDHNNKNLSDPSTPPVIIATLILTVILIVVVMAILWLVLNSRRRKKEERTANESSRSMLTFSNPNYNLPDGQQQPPPEAVNASSSKGSNIWKRLKYEKATERVYEEKCIGGESTTVTTNLITAAPSPMPHCKC